MDKIKFSEALERSGMTAYRLSKKTGISQSMISDLKSGRIKFQDLKLKNAAKLADVLELDVRKIY